MKIEIPHISKEELTPTVEKLLNVISQCVQIIEQQNKRILQLEEEIARLKGVNPRPKIKPSTLEKNNFGKETSNSRSNKKKSNRRKKKISNHK